MDLTAAAGKQTGVSKAEDFDDLQEMKGIWITAARSEEQLPR
jgi:hypothetical protein